MDTHSLLLILILGLLVIGIAISLFKKNIQNSPKLISELSRLATEFSQIGPLIRTEASTGRSEAQQNSKDAREELANSLKENRTELLNALDAFRDEVSNKFVDFNEVQRRKFQDFGGLQDKLREETEKKLERIRETVESKIQSLQEQNSKKLEEMRVTVDEKLQESVEKRFNETFKSISDRLDQVHVGLGEMQNLAVGVGDLKKVLTNVKTRGSLGEIQLGSILEQILAPDQYEKNAAVKDGSQERVEYVVKLPGKRDDNVPLLLPMDSKFPNEDYQRLHDAYENGNGVDPKELDRISKQFESAIKKNAKDIYDKYINPPTTTDFAIMFVPTESLYGEILRRTTLCEQLHRDYRVTVVGPTNLAAFLSSLQMGFRTLAIEKRSSEVWEILAAVKTQFGKFGDLLDKTRKKLQEATNTIDDASRKSRTIERKLKTVHELPEQAAANLLEDYDSMPDEEVLDAASIEG